MQVSSWGSTHAYARLSTNPSTLPHIAWLATIACVTSKPPMPFEDHHPPKAGRPSPIQPLDDLLLSSNHQNLWHPQPHKTPQRMLLPKAPSPALSMRPTKTGQPRNNLIPIAPKAGSGRRRRDHIVPSHPENPNPRKEGGDGSNCSCSVRNMP